MNCKRPIRILSLILGLTLLTAPAASAVSIDQARDLLKTNYIDELPDDILNLPSVKDITDAIGDPYTYYMTAEQYAAFQNEMEGQSTVGIGVMVQSLADGLEVNYVAPDSPAEKAGLLSGDVITAADGTTAESLGSGNALAPYIAGDAGTQLTITVRRDGESFDVTMTRAEVTFPTTTGQLDDGHIAWIDCNSFGKDTGTDISQAITDLNDRADRWVIDLRGNSGGYASAVIQAAGSVLGNYDVAYAVDRQRNVSAWRPNPLSPNYSGLIQEPLIVLVDSNSASASELFTAAIRDYKYGLIIGARTFGKGIAQNVFELDDGSAMRITTQRYYSPDWVTPDHTGVLPNLVVDVNWADEVAQLLSGTKTAASEDTLVITLLDKQWYVHKDAALSSQYSEGFAELLAALDPQTPMTLNGQDVTPQEVSTRWGISYDTRTFTDVDNCTEAERDKIDSLAVLGVVYGSGDGTFQPDGQLTRAELCAMLVQSMGYWCWSSQDAAPFSDVTANDWYSDVAKILYNLGLVKGNGDGCFMPDTLIDYEQFVTLLMRAGTQTDLTIAAAMDDAAAGNLENPANVSAFSSWAQDAVQVAQSLGITEIDSASADPHAIITRAEAADLVYNLMNYIGIITPVTEAE